MRVLCLLCVVAIVASEGVAEAKHIRLQSHRGPIHVWTPPSYDPETAGVVVYVHGYYTNVDRAWRQHRLAAQFRESGINALFIACEAPSSWREPVPWTSLDELLATVRDQLDGGLPAGQVVVVGHSGAHRTIEGWLPDHIDTIVLLDALYGKVDTFRSWLVEDSQRRLLNAAAVTRRWSEQLHALLPESVRFDRFPSGKRGRLKGARAARVVYVRSQHDHMGLVTNGVAIPILLRAASLPSASPRAPAAR